MVFATIIVLYKCNIDNLSNVLQSIISQTDYLILIKNDDTLFPIDKFTNPKIHLIDLNNNYGIAYAQNRGVEYAKKLNVDYLLFSDQDTIFPNNYISNMQAKILTYPSNTIFAPVFYNETKGQMEPVSLTLEEYRIPDNKQAISVFHAISSGTIVSMSNFEKIGYFNEDLFIDYVDFEWCWRARYLQYSIICFSDIKINHNLGDKYKIVFGKKVTIRSNFRYYYMIRNGLILSHKNPWLTNNERKILRKRTIIMMFGILLLNYHILSNIKTIIKAMNDYNKYIKYKIINLKRNQ